MPFILLLLGALLFVTAYNGTTSQLGKMLKDDIFGGTGTNGLLYWLVAIAIIGGLGYVKSLRSVSDAFIVLLLIVLFLAANTGFFDRFQQALKDIGSGASVPTAGAATAAQLPSINQPFGAWLK